MEGLELDYLWSECCKEEDCPSTAIMGSYLSMSTWFCKIRFPSASAVLYIKQSVAYSYTKPILLTLYRIKMLTL